MAGDEDDFARPEGWRTGTRIDTYTPVWLALQQRGVAPGAAAGLDVSVVAGLLGIGRDPQADWQAWAQEMHAGRAAAAARGEDWVWPEEREPGR